VTNIESLLVAHRDFILNAGGSLLARVARAAGGVLSIGVSVVIAGFLYRHGPALADALRAFARRIVADRGEGFVELAGSTVRNVSRGIIGVSVLQALLAGIAFLMIGIPGAGLLTFLVLIFAVIQIGATVVIVPCLVWAWLQEPAGVAIAFTAYLIPVALVDNVLKPLVMARGLRTPMLVILIGVLGGTLSHGLIGLFLGPVVLAVFYDLFTAWVKIGQPGAPLQPDEPLRSASTATGAKIANVLDADPG